jgi:hypothetical protein
MFGGVHDQLNSLLVDLVPRTQHNRLQVHLTLFPASFVEVSQSSWCSGEKVSFPSG